jgi:hypothetical protein
MSRIRFQGGMIHRAVFSIVGRRDETTLSGVA